MTRANARDHFEVDERLAADAPDLLHVTGAGDAENDRAEDDRTDDHLHQGDEAVAERLERNGMRRIEVAEEAPGDDGDEDLDIQMRETPPFCDGG